jgi:membrane protein DedA with SNARE-associated domain
MIPLLSIALGTFVSEDLTCIAVGTLVAQRAISFQNGVLACLAGIFTGDMLLFLAGRWIGRPALRFLSAARVERASRWLSEKGPVVVFASRFTPGLRTATYFAAGSLRTSFSAFAGYFLLASIVWTPLVVGLAALLGARFGNVRNGALVAFAVAAASIWLFRVLRDFERRRRLIGFLQRIVRWEFWPMWAAYTPLAPYLAYLAIRHRSPTLFTAANPGIATGGLVGESKSVILAQLERAAEFGVIPGALEPYAKLRTAEQVMEDLRLNFPVVLKPDVGQRGVGVAVIRSRAELASYLRGSTGDVILQRHISGLEFGVFYYRRPHESHGRIFSITEKRFPHVRGDGRATLRELILKDRRAVCIAETYARLSKRPMDEVPAEGELVKLVEIGSHCRGSIFCDAGWLRTDALERAVDLACKGHREFYFGRFDVRTPSIEAFQNGEFTVLELNGAGAEATHIYDPSVSLFEAYRVLFTQWRIAFEIGAENRRRGAQPMTVGELLRAVRGVSAPGPESRGGAESIPRPSR